MLEESNWMDDAAKAVAKEKVNHFFSLFGTLNIMKKLQITYMLSLLLKNILSTSD